MVTMSVDPTRDIAEMTMNYFLIYDLTYDEEDPLIDLWGDSGE